MRGNLTTIYRYNALIPALMPELPEKQKQAIAYGVKVPMMYNNVLVRRWTSFAKLGVANVTSPCMAHTGTSLDPGSTVGGYQGVTTPDVPPEHRPHVIGRQRFGAVTIANADAGAAAFTNQAIDEARRAVEELFVKNGLT